MPLSEFHPVTRTNLQSKMRNFSPDQPSSMPDNDFVELLWENGHIVMQGQSSRPKKTSLSTVFPSHSAKIQEKENGDAVIPRITPFGSSAVTDSIADDFSPAALSNHVGLSAQEDEMAPWINFPVDDYYSEFLSEFSGVNANSFPGNNHNPVPMDRGAGGTSASPAGGSSHLFRDSYQTDPHLPPKPPCGVPDMGRTKPANQIPQQWQNSAQSNRPRAFDFGAGNSTTTTSGQNAGRDHLNAKTQRQGLVPPKPPSPPPPGSSGGVMNFSHFSRPAALLKANLQNADRLRSNNKASTAASSNPMESTLIDSSSGLKTNTQEQFVSTSGKADLKSSAQPPHVQASLDRSEAINWKDASRNDNINTTSDTKNMKRLTDHLQVQKPSLPVPAAARRHEAEKAPEPVVASSSVCSGNGAGTSSSDPKQRAKRKITEGEDSGYHSEDAEDDSVGARKPSNARGANAKRSRAAEVHNLSERRRRDRINEKMRALQELIPNCNKVDKASMLDEAIEYLKTLQLQVQIMSMGGGLCMPPMMLPAGMQNIRAPHMAHFSPMVGMGMGMGMGMGFGMGMLDMNGSPLIPVPPMHGPQFPCSSVPGGAPGFNCIPGTAGLPMFGIPTQGVPVQMPPLPFAPPAAHSTRVNNASEANNAVETAPASSNEQRNQHLNVENGQRTDVNDSQVQASTQATRECFEHSSSVHLKNQTSTSDDAINSSSGNENSSTNTSYG